MELKKDAENEKGFVECVIGSIFIRYCLESKLRCETLGVGAERERKMWWFL